MADIWVTSDSHFSHANILTFMVKDWAYRCPHDQMQCDAACKATHPLKRLRDFASVEEMDETLVERWNAVVKPHHHVYHLGDVVIAKRHLAIVQRLNGHKRLIPGNHDIYLAQDYLKAGFEKLFGMRVLDNMLFTHVPVHPNSFGRFKANVHGHVHNNESLPLPYINVCVEVTDYRPVAFEELQAKVK